MATIFISYRRDDAFGHAGRMYDRLVYRFGPENIFMDLDSMQPGLDFEQVIEDTIARCDAVIAIIGKAWLSPTAEGASRLDDPHDWVRLELTYALRKKVRLIPVLVDGAGLPSAAELPSDLSALRRLHSIELSQATWNATATDLINTIDRLHPTTRRPGASSEAEALARQGSARRSERPQEPETWSVNDLKAPTSALRLVELRWGLATRHLLSIQKEIGDSGLPEIALNGEVQRIDMSGDSGYGSVRLRLERPLGLSDGHLTFQVERDYLDRLVFDWVVVYIDGKFAREFYGHDLK